MTMILVHFQGKPLNITVIQVYAPITDAEEAKVEWSYEDLDLLELTAKQRYRFHHRGLKCKLGSQQTSLPLQCKMKQGKG